MCKPVLSLHASSPPLCGAAPFPRSASSAPSRAVSSARVLAAAAARQKQEQEDESGSQYSDMTKYPNSVYSTTQHGGHQILDFYLNVNTFFKKSKTQIL